MVGNLDKNNKTDSSFENSWRNWLPLQFINRETEHEVNSLSEHLVGCRCRLDTPRPPSPHAIVSPKEQFPSSSSTSSVNGGIASLCFQKYSLFIYISGTSFLPMYSYYLWWNVLSRRTTHHNGCAISMKFKEIESEPASESVSRMGLE